MSRLLAKGTVGCNIFLQIIHLRAGLLEGWQSTWDNIFSNQQEYYLVLTEKSAARWGAGGSQWPVAGRDRGEGGGRLQASASFSLPTCVQSRKCSKDGILDFKPGSGWGEQHRREAAAVRSPLWSTWWDSELDCWELAKNLTFENWIVENLATLFWFENLIVRNLGLIKILCI